MKTSFTIIPVIAALILLLTTTIASATDKYTEAMQKNIETVYTGKSIEELQQAVNTLQRIGEAEKTKWEPFYYAAFGNIMMSTREQDKNEKDTYLDQALASVKKALALAPGESEIVALEGFVHMIRVTVDPATRGQQYAGLAMQSFSKARTMSPENPRAAILLAQMQYGTAQFFGSPTTDACGLAEVAREKFDTFKSDNPLAPQWGRGMVEDLVKKCEN